MPGLTDHLGSLLAALGYFLWQQSATDLLEQLIADQGRLNLTVLPGLLKLDLASLRDAPPVLCFDEVDLLRPGDSEAHARVIALLEKHCATRTRVPVYSSVSNRSGPRWGARRVRLDGLETTVLAHWLTASHIQLLPSDLDQLARHTNGNPHLINLFISLQHAGEPIETALARWSASPSIESLIESIVAASRASGTASVV